MLDDIVQDKLKWSNFDDDDDDDDSGGDMQTHIDKIQ